MVNFDDRWTSQKTGIQLLIQNSMVYISGRIYFSKWVTNDDFPHVQAYIVEDNPEIIRQSSVSSLYRTNTRWRFIYRHATEGDYVNSPLLLSSGVGAICNVFSDNQYYGSIWDYAVVDRVDFEYVSPDISPAVIDEAVVDVIIRSEVKGS